MAALVAATTALTIAPTTTAFGRSGSGQEVFAQKRQEFTQTIKKEFPISAAGTVSIANKYGKVEVKTWERNRVKVDATIVVKAGSESDAQRVFDRIRIDFTNFDSFVKAETIINPARNSLLNWGADRTDYQINYEVFMPASASLDLSNKYGDAFAMPISGKVNAEIQYGNLRLEGVGGELNLDLRYGSGTVVRAKNAVVKVSYSKATFTDIQNADLSTSYSKIVVDNGGDIKIDSRNDQISLGKISRFDCQSRYGNVEIDEVVGIKASSNYTDFKIGRVSDRGDFDLQYGGLRLDQLAKGFSSLYLLGKYSDFKIEIEQGAAYTLDATTRYAGISRPSGLNVTEESDSGMSEKVKGYMGTQNARSLIKANLSYGGLKLTQ